MSESYHNLNIYLSMLIMQKTLFGMQMEERVMDCYDTQPIHLNGSKLILFIHNLRVIQ